MANSKVVIQKWSQSLTRGSRLRTFPSVVIAGKILVFRMGVRPWEVVAHGGSTVLRTLLYKGRYHDSLLL